jgi:phage terminase large subunit-like protein
VGALCGEGPGVGRRRSAEVLRRPSESRTPRSLPVKNGGGENPASRFPERRQYRVPLGDHDGDKVMRLFAQTATIENGFVKLPEAAHWLPDYLAEFMLFPNAR